MRWDPTEYLRFEAERGRPFADLMSRVGASTPSYVVDLGCGPGNLTRSLADRWPAAEVEGVDSSAEMIERARREDAVRRVRFTLADLREWAPTRPVDVLTCNATLQWVPGHLGLLDRLVRMLPAGGWFVFQLPGNFGEPAHTRLADLRRSPRWQALLDDIAVPAAEAPVNYLRRLAGPGRRVDVWETTYLQVLAGEDPVLRWMEGTALRPVLSALDEAQQKEFTDEYAAALRSMYPREEFGTVLPYRRIFAVLQLTK